MTAILTSLVTPAIAIYLVNLAIAAVLISSCGLLAVLLFSRQSAPVRHAILVSTLVLTLLAPGMTWLACRNGWGQIAAIAFADDEAKRPTPAPEAAPEKDPAVRTTPDTSLPDSALPALPFALHPRKNASHEDAPAVTPVPAAPQASAPPPRKLPVNPPAIIPWRRLAIALAAWGWLLGTLIGAGRVTRGFIVLRCFRRSLETPSFDHLDDAASEASKEFGIKRLPPIRVSARAPAPLSLGLMHPLIVLPTHLAETSDAEQLRAILVHEMAHLVHQHHWIGLMQWLAGIMFWWNPLLHRVNRGILQLREEICDDHVLQSHTDGREFARVLVELAARLTDLPRIPATLAILETGYSDFQHRITNLLDKERTIVTRMTRKAVFSVILFGLAISLAVPLAGMRAEEKSNAVNAAGSATAPVIAPIAGTVPKQTAPIATTVTIPAAKRTMRVRVLGPDGKPMPGVKVHASIWTHEPSFKPNRDHLSDAEGWATVELPKTLYNLRLWADSPHYVPLFTHWEEEWLDAKKPLPEEFVFKLEKGTTIGGSVKNAEGTPIAGARICVKCYGPKFPEEQQDAMGKHAMVSSHLAEEREVLTDALGSWTLDNVPKDKTFKVSINVNHPDYVSDFIFGQMQHDQKVTSEDLRQQKATIVMRRGTVVSGKVTDPNGKPVPGAVVAWGRDPYGDTSRDQMFRHEVQTDAGGVYRLPPMPVNGPDLCITVMAQGWSPDMRLVSYAPKNLPADFQLEAGKHLRLRFVDESGKRIPEVYVEIATWRGGLSLYNSKRSEVLDTKIPEKADKYGVFEWTWAPADKVDYCFGKSGYTAESVGIAIAADGEEHEIHLFKGGGSRLVVPPAYTPIKIGAAPSPTASAGVNAKRAGDAVAEHSAAKDQGVTAEKNAVAAAAARASVETVSLEIDAELRLVGLLVFQSRMKLVDQELQLTGRQKEQIAALQSGLEPSWSSSPKKVAEAIHRGFQELQAILLPKQLDRAREIAIQMDGASAFFHDDVVKALAVTKDQRTEMASVYWAPPMGDLWRRRPPPINFSELSKVQLPAFLEHIAATEKLVLDKFLHLLSSKQREKYESLIGKKIDSVRLRTEWIDAALKEFKEFESDRQKSLQARKGAYSPDRQSGGQQFEEPSVPTGTDAVVFEETLPVENEMERLERCVFLAWGAESLQKELHFTDQQKEQLTAMLRHREPYLSDQEKRNEATQRAYRKLQAILLPKQINRAQEIALRLEGASAFFDADVIKGLEITNDQQTEMHAVYSKSKTAAINAVIKKYPTFLADLHSLSDDEQRALQEQGNALEKTLFDKLLKLLSPAQRARYEKMIGKKIDADRISKEMLDALLKQPRVEVRKTVEEPKTVYAPDNQNGDVRQVSPPSGVPDKIIAGAPRSLTKWRFPPEAAEAMKVLRAHPAVAENDRIAAALVVFRSCDMGDKDDGYPKEYAMRELIRIGKPAVARLTDELDRTESNHDLRDFGFVLRGIGDPRAVPALIRAIPRLAQPVGSDCGYEIKNDSKLLKFMQENDNTREFLKQFPEMRAEAEKSPEWETTYFYGRPINEIMPALQKITGENHGWYELAPMQIGKSAEQNRLRRLEFQKLAARWDEWWEKNWRKFVKDEGEAEIEPTRRALAKNADELSKLVPQPLTEIPTGKNVDTEGGSAAPFIFSFDDPRMINRHMACIDLDSGRMPMPPQELVKNSLPGTPSPALLSWAENEGVNLIGMKFRPHGSEKSYLAFQPLNMKVWRIDNARYDHLVTELQKGAKLDLPGLWEGPIASLDEKTGQIDESHPASFLFLTKRGICGAIRVQSKETYAMPKPGTLSSENKPAFEIQYIYRNDKNR